MSEERTVPRYPIYVPSKGRFKNCLTANCFVQDELPFRLVVEPQEKREYADRFGLKRLLVLPHDDRGLIYVRNWIKSHATEEGHERHWQLDDNIRTVRRLYRGNRIKCRAGIAFAAVEDFVDRYENIAVAGLNYEMFAPPGTKLPPFHLNQRVYSCSLVLNSLPYRWRSTYNDDTDYCLQVLAAGWCTVLVNVFLIQKMSTMIIKGGNTDVLYQGDGRLKMARSLERLWPGVVETKRRYKRPQHVVRYAWGKFDTPLKLKPGVDLSNMDKVDERSMRMRQVGELNEYLKGVLDEHERGR